MLTKLPESGRRRRRRSGSVLASVGVHAVLIALAIDATRSAGVAHPVEPPETVFIAFEPPPPEPTAPPEPAPRAPAPEPRAPSTPIPTLPPSGPVIDVPIDVPTGLPPIVDALPAEGDPVFRPGRASDRSTATGPSSASTDSRSVHSANMVDREVIPLAGTGTPRYPEVLRQAGVSGDVVARFIVDTLGRVEPGSVRMLTSTHELFERSVRAALASARFVPAEARGARVRQLVERPFRFEVVAGGR